MAFLEEYQKEKLEQFLEDITRKKYSEAFAEFKQLATNDLIHVHHAAVNMLNDRTIDSCDRQLAWMMIRYCAMYGLRESVNYIKGHFGVVWQDFFPGKTSHVILNSIAIKINENQ